jgi:hypothetical protein
MGGLYPRAASLQFNSAERGELADYVVKSQPLSSSSRLLRDEFLSTDNAGLVVYQKVFMSVPEQLPKLDQSEVANLSQTAVQFVQADLVRMYQADADVITADEVELRRSAVGNLKANHVTARKSALANVNATEFSAEKAATGYIQAEKVSMSGATGAVVAGSVEVHQGVTGLIVGNDIHVEGARTAILIGRNVTGSVVTLVDSRSALIAGLTGGLFAGLMLWLGRVLFRRK